MKMEQTRVSLEILEQIAQAIQSLRYGTVHVTIHDARVVQIDKVERMRIHSPTDRTSGGTRPAHGQ